MQPVSLFRRHLGWAIIGISVLIGGLTSLPLVIFSLAGPIGGKADVLTTLAWVGVWTAQVGILVGLVCLFIGLYAARTAKHRRKG